MIAFSHFRRLSALVCLWSFILASVPATAQDRVEPADASASLPTVDEILQRHIDARGGEELLRRHSHRTQTGTVEIPALEIEGAVRLRTASPHLFHMESDLGRHGVNRTGYDGVIGWTIDEINGPKRLRNARLVELRRQADFHADLNFREHYGSIELLGLADFHDIRTYELKMVDGSGKDVYAYFDAQSGLQVGLKGMFESHTGPIPVETVIAGYESFDGILLATRYETHFHDIVQRIDIVQHIKITEVNHELIDEQVFEVPASVRELPDDDEQEQKETEPASESRVKDVSNSIN